MGVRLASGPCELPVPASCWKTVLLIPGPEHPSLELNMFPAYQSAGIQNAEVAAANYLGAKRPRKNLRR